MMKNIFYKDYGDKTILNKMEFVSNSSDKKKDHIHQEPTQMLLRNYISRFTPYENVLLYHDVGTGKTCSAITIAEGFKEYVNNMGKKIIVLVKNRNIEKNFMGELLSKCTREEYLDSEEYDIYNEKVSYSGSKADRDEIIHKATKTISKSYQFITYGTFINRVLGAKEFEKDQFGQNTKRVKKTEAGLIKRKHVKDAIKNFNNSVIIVDEAHNITGNEVYTSLFQVLSKSYNYRLVLLTATPMYDNSTEIFELANLLNVNNLSLQLPVGNNLLRQNENDESYLIKKKSKYINRGALKGDIYEITEYGKKKLQQSLVGKVSYLRGNKETNPEIIDIGEELLPSQLGSTNVVFCEMSEHQYNTYLLALKSDLGEGSKYDISTTIRKIESEEAISENEIPVSKASSLYKNSSDASTMSYPQLKYGKTGFLSVFTKSGSKFILNTQNKNVLTSDLNIYSNKLYKLLQNITQEQTGNVFIYSNYVNYGGISLVKQVLLANGFYEFSNRLSSEERHYKSFVVFDENTSLKNREFYKRVFNSEENKEGKLIRIIIGSPIISEGITLKSVRQIHILEPYWNMSKINQIVGRGVRNYSHYDLPPSERNVEIYKYVSIINKKSPESTSDLKMFFIDKEKYILSQEKDISNKIIERLLKSSSFDCSLNIYRNILKDDQYGSPDCDYTDCNYKCEYKPDGLKYNTGFELSDIDKSTYNLYLNFFDQFDIYFILETIKDLFTKSFIWHIDDIKQYVKNLEPLITDESIYTTLHHITENKIYMLDMYDREGFIISKGPYYIFNETNINIDSTIYSKFLDFSEYTNKYTLNDYAKTLNYDMFEKVEPKKATPLLPVGTSSINVLTQDDLLYNDYIEANYTIYGTYRGKKNKSDTWDHKYGGNDGIFRIVDARDRKEGSDNREIITGRAAKTIDISKLQSIANALNIDTTNIKSKPGYITQIQNFLEREARIIK